MKHPSQEDLLGYVLGALEAQQQREVQQLIDSDPQLEEELLKIKASLQPLDHLDPPAGPPPGLARRTCEMVASLDKTGRADLVAQSFSAGAPDRMAGFGPSIPVAAIEEPEIPAEEDATLSPAADPHSSTVGGWSMSDLLVAVAAMAVLVSILLPAISYSRYQARVSSCQNNMRSLGAAMLSFSSSDPSGHFPSATLEGNLAASGIYAPILKESGLVENDSVFSCPGRVEDQPVFIPSVSEVESAVGPRLIYLHHTMGGHYGYTMGYVDESGLRAPVNLGRGNLILLSDMPSRDLDRRRSGNHEAKGQNLLFEDGRVEFVPGFAWVNDPIFENDYGVVAPGVNQNDNVIAPSHLGPNHHFNGLEPGMSYGKVN
ncbi:MAG: hypothetical protein AAF456_25935 [Planctomycetota bacterium]